MTSSQKIDSAVGCEFCVPVWTRRSQRRRTGRILVPVLVILGVTCVFVVATPLGGWLMTSVGLGQRDDALVFDVQPMDLRISIQADGVLESASSVDVVSEVEGQVNVVSMVPRGTPVHAGDLVVELDSSQLRAAVLRQQVVVQQAKAATAQAREALQLAESEAESNAKASALALRFAELDLKKYIEGDYPQERRTVESEVALAQEELQRANDRISYSEELKKLGYLSAGQVAADQLIATQSRVALELAQDKQRMLDDFSYQRTREGLVASVEEAQRSVQRYTTLASVTIEQSKANLLAQETTETLEIAKWKHLEDQIEKCRLLAPHDGVVTYALPEDDTEPGIRQGGPVRQRQHVFTIPNTDTLLLQASVHEASVHLVTPGKLAEVRIPSLRNRQLQGKSESVSKMPDLQSSRESTVNFYPVEIHLAGDTNGLRPGMTAKVEIVIDEHKGVLAIPISSIVRVKKKTYCYVRDSKGKPSHCEVELGTSNGRYVIVKSGITAGDTVYQSPTTIEEKEQS